MQCPVDSATLVMADRQGVEIDYCPQCRGVWLDRGELDKIIERAAPAVVGAGRGREPEWQEPSRQDDRYRDEERHRDDRGDRGDRGFGTAGC